MIFTIIGYLYLLASYACIRDEKFHYALVFGVAALVLFMVDIINQIKRGKK